MGSLASTTPRSPIATDSHLQLDSVESQAELT